MPTASRRCFLAGLGAVGALLAAGGVSFASVPGERRLVVVLLRYGQDGLSVVAPHGDPDYRKARGAAALPMPGESGGIVDLDGRFGLHPALASLVPLWKAGELGFVHAAAIPCRTRSHFDAQDVLENGTDTPHLRRDGWLNRAVGALASSGAPARAIAFGQGLPLVLRGDADASSLDPLGGDDDDDFVATVADLYRADPVLGPALDEARATGAMVAATDALGAGDGDDDGGRAQRAASRASKRSNLPTKELSDAVGRLIAAPDGPRVAVLDTGGWDTHQGEANTLTTRLGQLADALVALKASLGAAWSSTALVAVTEFGRTVAGNGTGGTDHGTAGAVWLAGGAVAGGKVHGRWPGLAPSALYEGRDLTPTTDVRSVFKGLLRDHLVVDEAKLEDEVFPDSRSAFPTDGLIRRT